MAAYNKFQAWVDTMVESANCSSDQFKVALTATANAPVATNSVLADLTEIAYTNLSTRNIPTFSSTQTTGTYSLVFTDLVLTASGGSVAAFRYVVVYDDTTTSPADALVAWFDYSSSVTLLDTEQLTLDFASTFFTLT